MSKAGESQTPTWPLMPDFSTDLFSGTAEAYARHRVPYPNKLLNDLRHRSGITGEGILIDLACGTGELAIPLSPYFRKVLAVDQEHEMISVGRKKAKHCSVSNIDWQVSRAEDVSVDLGSIELITIGAAFHRLDRQYIVLNASSWFATGGCLAVAGSNSVFKGKEEWQAIATDVINAWTHREGNGQVRKEKATNELRQTHEEVLHSSGFKDICEYKFPTPYIWTVDSFIGYLHSTSFASKKAFGDALPDFEADMRQALLSYNPSGRYPETMEFYYILAHQQN